MKQTIRSLLIYLLGGVILTLVLTGLSLLFWPYHPSWNCFGVGILYLVVGFSLTDSQSLASKPCMLQRNVDLDSRVKELVDNGKRFEGNQVRIVASYAFGALFLFTSYCWS
jgi:hypothetical protein